MTSLPASEAVVGPDACPGCGSAVAAGDRFCEACGHELPASVAPPSGPADAGSADDGSADDGAGAAGSGATAPPVCASCGAVDQVDADGYCGVCGTRQPPPHDHEEHVVPGAAAVTDRGRVHARNEDAVGLARRPDGALVAVVCDGVSTTVDPDEAAAAAVAAALDVLVAADLGAPEAAPAALLDAHLAARGAVRGVDHVADGDRGAPSCTFLAAVVAPDGAVDVAGLGDCRAYWIDGATGGAAVLTGDHSWAAEQVAEGALAAEEAYADPRAHMITRWIGLDADPGWRPDLTHRPAAPGRIVLCSDGLWNATPTPDDLVAAARPGAGDDDDPQDGGPLATARRLVRVANAAGGHDNITVVVADLPLPPPEAEADPEPDPDPDPDAEADPEPEPAADPDADR